MFSTSAGPDDRREEQDFVLRLVKQVIEALARIARLKEQGHSAQALAEIQEAYRDLLDLDPFFTRFLDGAALARFAGEKGLTRELGLLLAAEARLLAADGQAAEAARLAEKADFLAAASGPP